MIYWKLKIDKIENFAGFLCSTATKYAKTPKFSFHKTKSYEKFSKNTNFKTHEKQKLLTHNYFSAFPLCPPKILPKPFCNLWIVSKLL